VWGIGVRRWPRSGPLTASPVIAQRFPVWASVKSLPSFLKLSSLPPAVARNAAVELMGLPSASEAAPRDEAKSGAAKSTTG